MLLESMIEHLHNFRRDVVLGFFTVFHHVDMNGFVVVGVELEDITKEDKNVTLLLLSDDVNSILFYLL
jgi:hypothetical protein